MAGKKLNKLAQRANRKANEAREEDREARYMRLLWSGESKADAQGLPGIQAGAHHGKRLHRRRHLHRRLIDSAPIAPVVGAYLWP